MMSPRITFYDIPSTLPLRFWSPNTLKTRLALNFKGIEYTTVWIEYPDIADLCKEIKAAPSRYNQDGSPYYSLPIIHDIATGKVISDSFDIALYLDANFPDSPRLVKKGEVALTKTLIDSLEAITTPNWRPFTMPATHSVLNPPSQKYFLETREAMLGPLEKLWPAEGTEYRKERWDLVERSFNLIDKWFKLNEADGFKNGFLVGDDVTFSDFAVVSWIVFWRVHREDSDLYKSILQLNNGRWGQLVHKFEKYIV